MTILVTVDLPVTRADLEAVGQEMGAYENPPTGLIAHVATETEGGVHVVDIWESREDYDRFSTERLGPAVGKVAAERGIPMDGPPATIITDAFDLVRGP
jgi:hypothetical protein